MSVKPGAVRSRSILVLYEESGARLRINRGYRRRQEQKK